ncbi:MAG TPA: hypothetical protein VEH84_02875 [Alphaproteobacteria bacterium]|nr:hypothetical protein [Alphaproteobacteria bacterium]
MANTRKVDRVGVYSRGVRTGGPSELERERALIAEARAELDAGLGVTGGDAEAWLEAFASDGAAVAPTPVLRSRT